jgi:hypothetical protein
MPRLTQWRPYRLLPSKPGERVGFLFKSLGQLSQLGNPSLIALLLGLLAAILCSHAQLR